jgi:hypothetical protein
MALVMEVLELPTELVQTHQWALPVEFLMQEGWGSLHFKQAPRGR